MNTNTLEAAQHEDIVLLNRLIKLLEEQINVVHNSDITGRQIEILSEQTQTLVKKIAEKDILNLERYRGQREHIQRLYNNLNIAIIARKDETEKHLNQIRKGKKTIVAYRGNI